jgi:hypothetical protein
MKLIIWLWLLTRMQDEDMAKLKYLRTTVTNKTTFKKNIRADSIPGMLDIIQFRILRLPALPLKSYRLKYKKLQLYLFFCMV